MHQHPFPNTVVAPPSKAFVHSVPSTILSREQTPLGTAPIYPKDSFDESSTGCLIFTNVRMRVISQKDHDACSMLVFQSYSCHDLIV